MLDDAFYFFNSISKFTPVHFLYTLSLLLFQAWTWNFLFTSPVSVTPHWLRTFVQIFTHFQILGGIIDITSSWLKHIKTIVQRSMSGCNANMAHMLTFLATERCLSHISRGWPVSYIYKQSCNMKDFLILTQRCNDSLVSDVMTKMCNMFGYKWLAKWPNEYCR